MKTTKSLFMTMACTIVFTIFSTAMVEADLQFADMDDTWWLVLKSEDKGYVFNSLGVKPMKYKEKEKGYIYFPDGALVGTEYQGVQGVFRNEQGEWEPGEAITLTKLGGTPEDFLLHIQILDAAQGFVMELRAKLTEDKKNTGFIKSGQIVSMGGSFWEELSDEEVVAGSTVFKAKWIPEEKVPDDVRGLVLK